MYYTLQSAHYTKYMYHTLLSVQKKKKGLTVSCFSEKHGDCPERGLVSRTSFHDLLNEWS